MWWTQSDLALRNISRVRVHFLKVSKENVWVHELQAHNISYLNINQNSQNGSYDGKMDSWRLRLA